MQTHTIRNKNKPTPIVTFTPDFFKQLMQARPDSASLVLHNLKKSYQSFTGKTLAIDHTQMLALLERAGANSLGIWQSSYSNLPPSLFMVKTTFIEGFSYWEREPLDQQLSVAEAFYALLDNALIPPLLIPTQKP